MIPEVKIVRRCSEEAFEQELKEKAKEGFTPVWETFKAIDISVNEDFVVENLEFCYIILVKK